MSSSKKQIIFPFALSAVFQQLHAIKRTGYIASWIGGAALAASLAGCVLLDVRKNGQKLTDYGVIPLQITNAHSTTAYALALAPGGKPTVIAAQEVPKNGAVVLLAPVGQPCEIIAFSDQNGNRRFDPGEASARIDRMLPVQLSDAASTTKPHQMRLAHGSGAIPPLLAIPPKDSTAANANLDLHLGEVVSLADSRFSAENGTLGLWQPFTFLEKLGWGIYFLQPYDPQKIPVVFVYGINGSPQDWRSMIASLDQSKYQPWFFHYPSGIRLKKAANGLAQALLLLKMRYDFPSLYIVAHSMGGLVAGGAVTLATAPPEEDFIPKFVTLCTPWGGDASADSGVKHLKYPVPAWIDMQPSSHYLKHLFANKLPAKTRHFLIFDFQTHQAPWLKRDNDGVVQVASELFPPAQAGAQAMFGFPYNHVEILGKPDVHAKVNEYLSLP